MYLMYTLLRARTHRKDKSRHRPTEQMKAKDENVIQQRRIEKLNRIKLFKLEAKHCWNKENLADGQVKTPLGDSDDSTAKRCSKVRNRETNAAEIMRISCHLISKLQVLLQESSQYRVVFLAWGGGGGWGAARRPLAVSHPL